MAGSLTQKDALAVEMRPIDAVKPYSSNPRKAPPKAVDAVARSIERFGWRQPIVVDAAGVVIVGHTRLLAARKLGLAEVPVHVADMPESEARAYRVADNQTGVLTSWDDDLLTEELLAIKDDGIDLDVLAFKEGEIARLLAEPVVEDEVPEPPADPVTKPGDLWVLGEHRLLCGDSTRAEDVARVLGGAVVDGILTDPPYCSGGFQEAGKSAGSVGRDVPHVPIANDRLSTRGFTALLKSAFSNVNARYIYAFTDWRMWVHLFDIAESCGFCVRSMVVWDKGTPGMGRGWRCQHELILWGCKETAPFDKHASGQGNVLTVKRTGNEHHTTEKPVVLLATLLVTTPFIESVIDPFAGSGSTLIACEQVGRRCYAIELSPAYVDVCVQRWEKLTGGKARLEAADG